MSKTLKEYDRYLPVSERGRQWGLYVTGGGFGQVEPGGRYPRNGHPASYEFAWQKGRSLHEYQIVYIRSGEGVFHSGATGERPIDAGTVFLLFPDVWHRYRPDGPTGWEEYWVGFAGEDADRLLMRGFISPEEPLLQTGPDDLVLHAFHTLLDRMRSEPVGFEQLIAASVWEILAAVLGAARRQATGSRLHELVRRAKMILEDPTESLPVIEDLAAALGVSPGYLQHVFKEQTGLSPYQYHLQLKMQRAREMLRGSDLPVKQIARILRFQNVYHFSTLFKKKIGVSPSVWRASEIRCDPSGAGDRRKLPRSP
jgi:AraC-like DNA-binding protein